MDLTLASICTHIAFGGMSLKEIGFPDEWEYNPFLMGYEKDGLWLESEGVKTQYKYFLSKKELWKMEKHGNNRPDDKGKA